MLWQQFGTGESQKGRSYRWWQLGSVRDTSGNLPFKCQQCNVGFKLKAHLTRHNTEAHDADINDETKEWKCTTCPRRFSAKCQLKLHMKRHSSEKTFDCWICYENIPIKRSYFKSRMSLIQHHQKFHPDVCVSRESPVSSSATYTALSP